MGMRKVCAVAMSVFNCRVLILIDIHKHIQYISQRVRVSKPDVLPYALSLGMNKFRPSKLTRNTKRNGDLRKSAKRKIQRPLDVVII